MSSQAGTSILPSSLPFPTSLLSNPPSWPTHLRINEPVNARLDGLEEGELSDDGLDHFYQSKERARPRVPQSSLAKAATRGLSDDPPTHSHPTASSDIALVVNNPEEPNSDREPSESYSPYLSPRELHPSQETKEAPAGDQEEPYTPAVVSAQSKPMSLAEAKKKAQAAILSLWPLEVRLQNYLDEGIDENVIRRLFLDLGLDINSPQKIPSPEPKTKSRFQATQRKPTLIESLAAQPSPASSLDLSETTNHDKSEERKDRIARLLAAKASKAIISTSFQRAETQPIDASPPLSVSIQKTKSFPSHRKKQARQISQDFGQRSKQSAFSPLSIGEGLSISLSPIWKLPNDDPSPSTTSGDSISQSRQSTILHRSIVAPAAPKSEGAASFIPGLFLSAPGLISATPATIIQGVAPSLAASTQGTTTVLTIAPPAKNAIVDMPVELSNSALVEPQSSSEFSVSDPVVVKSGSAAAAILASTDEISEVHSEAVMNDSTAASERVISASQREPSTAVGMPSSAQPPTRKRPVAADFVDDILETRTKRKFIAACGGKRLIIDVSDASDEDEDEDRLAMDLDPAGPSLMVQPVTSSHPRQISSQRLAASFRERPPLSDNAHSRTYSAPSSATGLAAPPPPNIPLQRISEKIEDMKRKIALAEARKRKLATVSPSPWPASPSISPRDTPAGEAPFKGHESGFLGQNTAIVSTVGLLQSEVRSISPSQLRPKSSPTDSAQLEMSQLLPIVEASVIQKRRRIDNLRSEIAALEKDVESDLREQERITQGLDFLRLDVPRPSAPRTVSELETIEETAQSSSSLILPSLVPDQRPSKSTIGANTAPLDLDSNMSGNGSISTSLQPADHREPDVAITSPEESMDHMDAHPSLDNAAPAQSVCKLRKPDANMAKERASKDVLMAGTHRAEPNTRDSDNMETSSRSTVNVVYQNSHSPSRTNGFVARGDLTINKQNQKSGHPSHLQSEPVLPGLSQVVRSTISGEFSATPHDHDGDTQEVPPSSPFPRGMVKHQLTAIQAVLAIDGKSQTGFVPYQTPLRYFRAFRFHPDYSKIVSGGLCSLTYSNAIDHAVPLCREELLEGKCNVRGTCPYQHFDAISISDERILNQLGACPDSEMARKDEYIDGLRDLLCDFRDRKVKDFKLIMQSTIEYRSRFQRDKTRILPLGGTAI